MRWWPRRTIHFHGSFVAKHADGDLHYGHLFWEWKGPLFFPTAKRLKTAYNHLEKEAKRITGSETIIITSFNRLT